MENVKTIIKPGYIMTKGDDTFMVVQSSVSGSIALVNLRTAKYNFMRNMFPKDRGQSQGFRVIAKNYTEYHNLINGVEE